MESVRTTDIYSHGDLSIEEQALARTKLRHVAPGRYKHTDTLLAFPESLRPCDSISRSGPSGLAFKPPVGMIARSP
jgi:hypothetical protein